MSEKKHCQVCWAYYQNTKCIAPEYSRKVLCQKAMERIGESAVKKEANGADEAVNLKKYLKYIPKRIAFLESVSGKIVSNEQKYYRELQQAIKGWGKTHALFLGCIYGKISVKEAKSICGVSERTFYRMMSKQRKALIAFIEKQETILDKKYPFIAMTDIFMD